MVETAARWLARWTARTAQRPEGRVGDHPASERRPCMTRLRLPSRRRHEAIALMFRGRSYTVGFNRRADGQISEIFLDAAKQSTDAADDARDLALAVSIGLQHGVPLD